MNPTVISEPGTNRLPARLRRSARRHRLGTQLWALLHAPALLGGPGTDPYQR